jgi:NADH-quinone oxidoreductase subunit C
MNIKEIQVANKELKVRLESLKESYPVLMDLTGVDYITYTQVVYLLHNPDTLERMLVSTHVPRGEFLASVCDLWAGANWYERELFDLFGVVVINHPNLKRILMPDDWQGYPLRRDYALTEEPVEFTHGVKPKIPSKIIPYVQAPRPS